MAENSFSNQIRFNFIFIAHCTSTETSKCSLASYQCSPYQSACLLIIPRISKSTIGGRAFCYPVPLLWKNLPASVREADTLSTIKSRLRYPIVMNNASKPGTCRNIRHTCQPYCCIQQQWATGSACCTVQEGLTDPRYSMRRVLRLSAASCVLLLYPATLAILV